MYIDFDQPYKEAMSKMKKRKRDIEDFEGTLREYFISKGCESFVQLAD